MPRQRHQKLPSRAGFCKLCNKDFYPDEVAASLALEFFARNPHRGAVEPVRFYPCPHTPKDQPKFHLTSMPVYLPAQELKHSA